MPDKRPRLLNKICARPGIVACVFSACLFVAVSYRVADEEILRNIPHNWQWMLYFWILAVPAATLLAIFFGYIIFGLPIEIICRTINGAPLKLGDKVIVLSGAHKGVVTEVYDIALGEGGDELARVDLGPEEKDIFQEFSLLRIKRSEESPAVIRGRTVPNMRVKPRLRNKICAYPIGVAFACMIVVCGISALLIHWLRPGVSLQDAAYEIPGYFLGVMVFTPLLTAFVCRKINGAAPKPGDQVLVMFGAYEGITGELSKIMLQPGWTVAILDLGMGCKQSVKARSLIKVEKANKHC